ncbi:MAG: DUF3090 domain-containing protein [Actinomycetota bacterium]|nr:DUF3090 domain-containing protein [Actinomycetota bacterium]
MPVVHRFDPPERFVAGTVGQPGQRVFFLQARAGSRVTSVALEKEQVAVLAERIDEMLDELLRGAAGAAAGSGGSDVTIPATAPAELEDSEPLDQPIQEEFRAGTMTLAWDAANRRVVVEVFPVKAAAAATDEEDEEEPTADEVTAEEVLEVHLEPGAARAFVKRALAVVSAGRPPCPFCGSPLDPEGHVCPRANGFKRLRQ